MTAVWRTNFDTLRRIEGVSNEEITQTLTPRSLAIHPTTAQSEPVSPPNNVNLLISALSGVFPIAPSETLTPLVGRMTAEETLTPRRLAII